MLHLKLTVKQQNLYLLGICMLVANINIQQAFMVLKCLDCDMSNISTKRFCYGTTGNLRY